MISAWRGLKHLFSKFNYTLYLVEIIFCLCFFAQHSITWALMTFYPLISVLFFSDWESASQIYHHQIGRLFIRVFIALIRHRIFLVRSRAVAPIHHHAVWYTLVHAFVRGNDWWIAIQQAFWCQPIDHLTAFLFAGFGALRTYLALHLAHRCTLTLTNTLVSHCITADTLLHSFLFLVT